MSYKASKKALVPIQTYSYLTFKITEELFSLTEAKRSSGIGHIHCIVIPSYPRLEVKLYRKFHDGSSQASDKVGILRLKTLA